MSTTEVTERKSQGFSVTSMVTGIVGLVFSWVPFLE